MELATLNVILEIVFSLVIVAALVVASMTVRENLGEILAIIAPGEVEDELKEKEELLEKLQVEVEKEKALIAHYREKIVPDLEGEIRTLKMDRTIEEREIKHLIKLEREAWANEKTKFEQDTLAAKNSEVFGIKEEFLGKQIAALDEQVGRSDVLLEKILARLPNANMEITEDRNISRDQAGR